MAQPEPLHSARSIRTERENQLIARYGGIHWGADFIGFVVALFFTMAFFGIVGAIVEMVGYQTGTPVPKVGGPISGTTQNLDLVGLIGGLIAIFLAYLIGGYTAGRMVRFSGVQNGVGVVIWTVIVAIILGILGVALGTRFHVGGHLNLDINTATLATASVGSVIVTLLVMSLGALPGGQLGANYHRAIDRERGAAVMVQDYDGASAVDPAGNSIGAVERTYDDSQGAARFVEVKIGSLFAKHRLIPVAKASFADATLTVSFSKPIVEDSPDAGQADEILDGNLMQAAQDYYDSLGQSALPASVVATANTDSRPT